MAKKKNKNKNKAVAKDNKERSNAMALIPAKLRDVVQSLKETTNCPEDEIYQTLQECNMDPDDAYDRLVSQERKKAVAKNIKESSNAVASIPAESRGAVQSLKETTDCPEDEIYQMLQECNMDPNKAFDRLIIQERKNKESSNAMVSIPAESRKVVQSLKETTNRPEDEIYQMLQECNMDPDVAYNRLVIQEREKKRTKKKNKRKAVAKNNKESSNAMASIPAESREVVQSLKKIADCPEIEIYKMLQECNMDPNTAFNRLVVQDPFQVVKSRRERRKGNKNGADHRTWEANNFPNRGFHDWEESSAGPAGSTQIQLDDSSASHSKPINRKENETQADSTIVSSAHCLSGNNINQNPSSQSESLTTENKVPAAGISGSTSSAQSAWSVSFGQFTMADIVKMGMSEGKVSGVPSQPQDNIPTNSSAPTGHNIYLQDEWSQIEQPSLFSTSPVLKEDFSARNLIEDHRGDIQENISQSVGSYLSYRQNLEHSTAEERATSVAKDLWQLDLDSDHKEEVSDEVKPVVIIPNHLRRHALGSSNVNLDGTGPDSAPDIRNTENYEEQNVRDQSVESSVHGSGQNAKRYYSYFGSHSDVVSPDTSEPAHGYQYECPSYAAGYNYDSYHQLNAALPQPQTRSQMQNFSPSFAAMQTYTSFLPGTLWPPSLQTVREPNRSFPLFSETQSIPALYSDLCSVSRSSESSLSRAVRRVQPTQQMISGANIAAEPAFHQQLAVHPLFRSTRPVGNHADMTGYSSSQQGATYMPSAFQQAYAGNSTNNQSLAAVLREYEDSIYAGSLPQSGTVASGYGSRRSASIPGHDFPANPHYAPRDTTMGFDDVLSSQYRESDHTMPFQQNENSAMRVHEPGSRIMSGVPENTYYGFDGQNQQQSGFRQYQQPSGQLAGLGYQNLYRYWGRGSPEHQQNPRDGSLYGSPDQVRQSQQIWRNSQHR